MDKNYSISPDGEKFRLPEPDDYVREFDRLRNIVREHRDQGCEIVVVMGVGFVGAVMAAVVADTEDDDGNPIKFVIGMQRPSTRSYWKIPLLNRGLPPVQAEDPEVAPMIHRCV
ncbi:MAG: GDP-mannose dehydrogenase, partial [Desulfobacterales bacterium]